MTTTIVYGDAADGYLQSDDQGANNYSAARAGTIYLFDDNASATGAVGQYKFSLTHYVYEMFISFDTSPMSTETISAATLACTVSTDNSSTDFTVDARLSTWPTVLYTTDWVAGASLSGLTLVAHLGTSGGLTANTAYSFTDDALPANIAKTGTTALVLASDRTASATAPTGLEYVNFYTADSGGTTYDPKLTLTHTSTPIEKTGTAETGTGSDVGRRDGWAATGSGSLEISSVAAAHARTDTSAAADTKGDSAFIRLESGAASDTAALANARSGAAESGTGSDTAALANARSGTAESGTGSDTASAPTAAVAGSESGTGAEVGTKDEGLVDKGGTAEAGTGSDSATLAVAVSGSSEIGTATEVGSKGEDVTEKSGTAEAGTGSESSSPPLAAAAGSETGTGGDSSSAPVVVRSASAESGVSSDLSALAVARSGAAESGVSSDVAALAVARSGAAEAGTGSESSSAPLVARSTSDTGTGAEASSSDREVGTTPDSGSATDVAGLSVELVGAETAAATESGGRDLSLTASDSGGLNTVPVSHSFWHAGGQYYTSLSPTYAIAREFGGAYQQNSGDNYRAGQSWDGYNYLVYQSWLRFDTSTLPSNAVIASATLEFIFGGQSSTPEWVIEVRVAVDGIVTRVPGSQLSSYPLVASLDTATTTPQSRVALVDQGLIPYIKRTGYTTLMVSSSEVRLGINEAYMNNVAWQYYSPYLTVTYYLGGETAFVDHVPVLTDSGTLQETASLVAGLSSSESSVGTTYRTFDLGVRTDSSSASETAAIAQAKYATHESGVVSESLTRSVQLTAFDSGLMLDPFDRLFILDLKGDSGQSVESGMAVDVGEVLARELALLGMGGRRRYKQRDHKTI